MLLCFWPVCCCRTQYPLLLSHPIPPFGHIHPASVTPLLLSLLPFPTFYLLTVWQLACCSAIPILRTSLQLINHNLLLFLLAQVDCKLVSSIPGAEPTCTSVDSLVACST